MRPVLVDANIMVAAASVSTCRDPSFTKYIHKSTLNPSDVPLQRGKHHPAGEA